MEKFIFRKSITNKTVGKQTLDNLQPVLNSWIRKLRHLLQVKRLQTNWPSSLSGIKCRSVMHDVLKKSERYPNLTLKMNKISYWQHCRHVRLVCRLALKTQGTGETSSCITLVSLLVRKHRRLLKSSSIIQLQEFVARFVKGMDKAVMITTGKTCQPGI